MCSQGEKPHCDLSLIHIYWDLVIFDEYHFGAWKDNAKKLFESDEDSYDCLLYTSMYYDIIFLSLKFNL